MSVHRESLTEQVREELKRRIMSAELSRGSRVDVEGLAAELSVSPSPVKDALRQLAREGLVEIKARSGTHIRTFDQRDVNEIYDCRRMIEPAAAAIVATRGATDALRAALEATIDGLLAASEGDNFLRPIEVSEADAVFHRAIIEAAGNRVLAELHTVLIDRALVIRSYASSGSRSEETVAEHRAILGAILAGDPAGAADASTRHLDEAEAFVLASLVSDQKTMKPEETPE